MRKRTYHHATNGPHIKRYIPYSVDVPQQGNRKMASSDSETIVPYAIGPRELPPHVNAFYVGERGDDSRSRPARPPVHR